MPMSSVSVRQLRNHTAEVVERVRAGEIIQVTVYGKPTLELRPIHSANGGWLAQLAQETPYDSGFADWFESQRERDIALDWDHE